MTMATETSFPFLAIARRFNLPYCKVVQVAHELNTKRITCTKPYFGLSPEILSEIAITNMNEWRRRQRITLSQSNSA